MQKYLVTYTAYAENNTVAATYGVMAISRRDATAIVTKHIEENNHHNHNVFSDGFYLYAKVSTQKADFEILSDELSVLKNQVKILPPELQKKGNHYVTLFEEGKVSYMQSVEDIINLSIKKSKA